MREASLPLEPREYRSVVPAGFEPATSTTSEWRALQAAPRNHVSVGPAGVEPASNRISDGCLAARTTARRKSVQRESHPPVRRGRPVPGCSATDTEQGRKESNPLRVGWKHTAHPGARPCRSVRMVGVEPTLSGFRRRRITRLSHILRGGPYKSHKQSNKVRLPFRHRTA